MIILPQQCRKTITDIIMAKIAGLNYCVTSVTYPNTCCYTRDPPNASQGMHDSKGYIRGPQFSFPAINNWANNKSYSHFIYRIKFQMTPYAVVEFEDDHSIAIIHTQWFTGGEEAFACGHSQAIRVLSCCETVTILQQTGFHSPSGSLERPVCIPRHNII